MCLKSLFFTASLWKDPMIISTSQVKRLRQKSIKELAQGYTTNGWENWWPQPRKSGCRAMHLLIGTLLPLCTLSNRLLSKWTHWPLPGPKRKGSSKGKQVASREAAAKPALPSKVALGAWGLPWKNHRQGLNHKNVFSHCSRGSESKVLADLVALRPLS